MATASQSGKASPERIFGTLTAFQQTEALKAAIELDIFTKIGEGATEAAAIAKAIGASERGTRILCDYMTVQGFLGKEGRQYRLTPDAAVFLDRRSPAYMGAMAGFLAADMHRANFGHLADAVRKGGTVGGEGSNLSPHDEFWVEFAKSMAGLATPGAEFIAHLIGGGIGAKEGKAVKVLDIAAGHGMFGLTIARHNAAAQIVALDWPNVLAVAEQNAKRFGVAERWTKKAGSAFETEFGEGYDYILLTNILHHFDHAGCVKLMKRVHAALAAGGKAVTLEFVPNDDRVSPPIPAAFSMVMLANTDSGDAYTFAELDKIFGEAGFTRTEAHPIPEMPQTVLVSEK